jgi:OOP family OmpA-OmpF porin
MKTRITLAAAALAFAAVLPMHGARAQAFYLGGEGGWTLLTPQNDHFAGAKSHDDFKTSGYNGGARGGYLMGPWRFEEEYSYSSNNLSSSSLAGPGASGSRRSQAIMTNLLYDFDLGWPVTPHIGAGVGAVDITNTIRTPALPRIVDSSAWQFGYQGIAGLRYMWSPNFAVDADYRYLRTLNANFAVPGGGSYRTGYATHNIVLSVAYIFAPPAPPPPLAPAAAPAPPPPPQKQVFLVFFDWDRDTITPAGAQIIQQAANAYKSGAPVQIQVTGYTDRSGSPGYNQRLSERRANNVANALAADGVPREQMAVSGRGENDNRVPTGPGVREPQNRRVEIVWP